MANSTAPIFAPEEEAFLREISSAITQRTGVQLGAKQMAMVESRLKRRVNELGLSHLQEYKAHFSQNRAQEMEALVSLLTTHHTFFFREFVQFEFLEQKLPALVAGARARGTKTLEFYSAACSRGQEVYSLAMHLDRHLKIIAPDFDFRIFGSDVDPESVKIAANGVYRHDELKAVPIAYYGNHWARGTKEIADFAKAKKSLRDKCAFQVINLMDLKPLAGKKFDAIFCRNVFIYFTSEQVKSISANFGNHLYDQGFLFVGVSESLHSLGLSLHPVGPSVYSPLAPVKKLKPEVVVPSPEASVPQAKPLPNPLRVLCVDDSPSILALLKKILSKEHGFEVVGTAGNGAEAAEQVAKLDPHVMTLDIHMPVKTGIEYLEGHKKHPPVVMVTSVAREDAGLAWKALKLGAADYVEKPALNNLEERADEIRMKLKTAFRSRNGKVSKELDRAFAKKAAISSPAKCSCVCVMGLGALESGAAVVAELAALGVHVFVGMEGADGILSAAEEKFHTHMGTHKDKVKVAKLKEAVKLARVSGGPLSVMVWGELSTHGAQEILSLSGAQLLLEDLGDGKGASKLEELASDVLPATSFAYLAAHFFADKQKGEK